MSDDREELRRLVEELVAAHENEPEPYRSDPRYACDGCHVRYFRPLLDALDAKDVEVAALREQNAEIAQERDLAEAETTRLSGLWTEAQFEIERHRGNAERLVAGRRALDRRVDLAEAELAGLRQRVSEAHYEMHGFCDENCPIIVALAADSPEPTPTRFVDAQTIHACFDAKHDVGMRHEDGSLYSATCRDCGHRYHRGSPEPERSVQRYEPCVLGADGRCGRFAHLHDDEAGPVQATGRSPRSGEQTTEEQP